MMPDQTTLELNANDQEIRVGSYSDVYVVLTIEGRDEIKARIARLSVSLELDEAEWLRDALQKKIREIEAYQQTQNKAKGNG